MKIELTNNFETFMRTAFPCLAKAEEAIYEVMGVTLDDMRSECRFAQYTYARAIFFHLCIHDVQRALYLSSYLNRDHSSGAYYHKYNREHQFDFCYMTMFEKVINAFQNK